MLTDGPPSDHETLRLERLERLQQCMTRHSIQACLFFNPANVRYATGSNVMGVYSLGSFIRCAVVPADGKPVLYEHDKSIHLSELLVEDVRPLPAWDFSGYDQARGFARELASCLRELGLDDGRLALDRLDTPGFLALQDKGLTIVDSSPITIEARQIKTPQELDVFRTYGWIGDAMLEAFEAAIEPGVREFELLDTVNSVLLRHGGEHLITRVCASGPNTNPWQQEADGRAVQDGDILFADTDAIGPHGYLLDITRTFLCGDRPTAVERDAYQAAHRCVQGMRELLRPGLSFAEFAEQAPALPERYEAQRYEVMMHQAGLEDEGPCIPYPDDPLLAMPDQHLEEGMVVCLECYAGEPGGRFGVKLEDQLIVTDSGAELVCKYPYDRRFLD